MPRRPDLPSLLLAGLSILYPLASVVLLRLWGAEAAIAVLLVLLAARLVLPIARGIPKAMPIALVVVFLAVAIVAAFDKQYSIRMYPVFMSLAMLAAFAATLWSPPSMVERFARIMEPDLPESGVRYTRKVTIAWVCFFCLNAGIAFWTVLQPGWKAWMFYNGFLSYVAVGGFFAVEYLIRRRVRRMAR